MSWADAVMVAQKLTLPERYSLKGLGRFPMVLRDPGGETLDKLAVKGLCDEYGLTHYGREVLDALWGTGPTRRRRVPLPVLQGDERRQALAEQRKHYRADSDVLEHLERRMSELDQQIKLLNEELTSLQ